MAILRADADVEQSITYDEERAAFSELREEPFMRADIARFERGRELLPFLILRIAGSAAILVSDPPITATMYHQRVARRSTSPRGALGGMNP